MIALAFSILLKSFWMIKFLIIAQYTIMYLTGLP